MDSFIDIKVRIDFPVLKEYLLDRKGLLGDLFWITGGIFFCVFAAAFQLALPSALPELPLYPAVLVSSVLFRRGGRLSAVWPLLTGFFIDCGNYSVTGMSSFFMIICCSVYCLVGDLTGRRMQPYVGLALSCSAATLCWCLLMLLFGSRGMDFYGRIALVPRELVFAPVLSMLVGVLFLSWGKYCKCLKTYTNR